MIETAILFGFISTLLVFLIAGLFVSFSTYKGKHKQD